jgi:hypothetical protein
MARPSSTRTTAGESYKWVRGWVSEDKGANGRPEALAIVQDSPWRGVPRISQVQAAADDPVSDSASDSPSGDPCHFFTSGITCLAKHFRFRSASSHGIPA